MEIILGFYGENRGEAWAEALRLAEIIEARGEQDHLRVYAKWHRPTVRMSGEYVVMLVRVEDTC